MNIIGLKVMHKVFGTGTIIEFKDNLVAIEFSSGTKKFQPEYIDRFLEPLDTNIKLTDFCIAQREQQGPKQLTSKGSKRLIGKSVMMEVAQSYLTRTPTLLRDSTKKPATYFVFQGKTFDRECNGGYIWAPIYGADGRSRHHWDRLLEIQQGDIIFHGCKKMIVAISTANGPCYNFDQPKNLTNEQLWEKQGRRVDCTYVRLRRPVETAMFLESILAFCHLKNFPFNQNGSGNMGYLFELPRTLAKKFMQGLIDANPYLFNYDFIVSFLKG